MDFLWIKLHKTGRFQPGFVFPLEKNKEEREAQYILSIKSPVDKLKSDDSDNLSDKKHPVYAIANQAEVEKTRKSKKSAPYLAGIKIFNDLNNTKFS